MGQNFCMAHPASTPSPTPAPLPQKLIEPTSGSITFDDQDVLKLSKPQLKQFRQRVQTVFQDPHSPLNPVFTVGRIIEEPLAAYHRGAAKELRLSYLFFSHDLGEVRLISDDVCVMKDGELVEAASGEEIFTHPRPAYSRTLLASIPCNKLDNDVA